jgi:hypothetical protein
MDRRVIMIIRIELQPIHPGWRKVFDRCHIGSRMTGLVAAPVIVTLVAVAVMV